MHAGALTELVGREEELDLLLRRWSRAKTGEGQVVLLSGEPGIGKSRLTAALLLPAELGRLARHSCAVTLNSLRDTRLIGGDNLAEVFRVLG
jgi:hypothetical protein